LVVPQNRWREDGTEHASRFGGLLQLKASHIRVSQSGLKIGEGVTIGDAYGIIVEVASRELKIDESI
jgi:hypothetical protein